MSDLQSAIANALDDIDTAVDAIRDGNAADLDADMIEESVDVLRRNVTPTPEPLSDEEKATILRALYSDSIFGLVSIEPDYPDGTIIYDTGLSSHKADPLKREPAIEIPHDDPFLVDESEMRNPETGRMESVPGVEPPGKTFEELVASYGCRAIQDNGYTYVIVDENLCASRPILECDRTGDGQ